MIKITSIMFCIIFTTIPTSTYAFNIFPEWLFPSYNAHKAYQQKEYGKAKDLLEQKQVETPNDPLLNYNLGAIYYKQKRYDDAKENFTRAATHAFDKDDTLLEKSRFNLGNSFYQNTLAMLPENWEKEKLEESILKQAINEVSQSIEQFKNTLSVNKENQKAQTNKKAAKKLLAKLTKQEQQQQQNKDQNKDQDKKEKDEKDKQDKDKQNQQQNKQQQDKDKQNQQQQDRQNQDEQKKQNKQNQQNQQQQQAHQNSLDKQEKKESMEERRVRALLNKLENQEKKLQKKLLKQKTKADKKPQNGYQKPW